jgi:putative tricarboxylic transport membrane protein
MALGAFQSTRHMGDLVALFFLGLLGWGMKRAGWPRAPLLIGFVLARPMERYFWLTVRLHEARWLIYPGVLLIGALMIAPFILGFVRRFRGQGKAIDKASIGSPIVPASDDATRIPLGTSPVAVAMSLIGLLVFGYALWRSIQFQPDARLLPLLAAVPGTVLATIQLFLVLRGRDVRGRGQDEGEGDEPKGGLRDEVRQFGLVALYLVLVWVAGFHGATALFLGGFLIRFARLRPPSAVAYAGVALAVFQVLTMILGLRWPPGLLFR